MGSKTLAAALIVLTFLGTGGWSHVESDDPDFLPPAATHDHSTHHEAFRTPVAPEGAAHCAICHWLQMFRASAPRHARLQFSSATNNARVVTAIPPVRTAALLDVPSRAPPA
ncbi:MAG: hypothetical protein EXQ48_08930 [Acidobacteria bacterium]|nr:hypothetical protein [Acidobacteriota bacterium]